MKFGHNKSSTILGEIPLQEVLTRLTSDQRSHRTDIRKDGRKYSIVRLQVFAYHGCKCHFCGIEGTKIILTEDVGKGLHCDLYAEISGGYRLMNRDHILPASLGGKDNVWNMRPTCYKCNQKRGNTFTDDDKKQLEKREVMVNLYRFFRSHRHRSFRLSHKWAYNLSEFVSSYISLERAQKLAPSSLYGRKVT